jgi:hypothetical protein
MSFCKAFVCAFLISSVILLAAPCPAQVVVDGEGPASKSGFLVDITSVEVRKTSAGPTIILHGTSRFPNGTQAVVAIKFDDSILPDTNLFVTVDNHKFEVVWDAAKLWPDKKFFPGNYNLEVEVRFSLQRRSIRKSIEKEFEAQGKGSHKRNMYVTLGTAKQVKEEEDKVRKHYIHALRQAENLLADLENKYALAGTKFRKQFRKLDKEGKPQIDPGNANSYLVDEQKFLKHLRDNPNRFYDDKGRFKNEAWRKWLDESWRVELKKLCEVHRRMRGDYVITAWPKEYDNMTLAIGMLLKLGAEYSVRIYKWNDLALDPNDKVGGESTDMTSVPAEPRLIRKLLKEIWLNLRLDRYLQSKQEEEVQKKTDGQ